MSMNEKRSSVGICAVSQVNVAIDYKADEEVAISQPPKLTPKGFRTVQGGLETSLGVVVFVGLILLMAAVMPIRAILVTLSSINSFIP